VLLQRGRRRRGERNHPRDAAQSGEGGFTFEQCNAVLIGGTGVGKSHLAIAIARSCVSDCISGDMANECGRRNAMIPRPG
jgi:DNA replication protein DnaC